MDWLYIGLAALVAVGGFALGFIYDQNRHNREVKSLRSNNEDIRKMLSASRGREQNNVAKINELTKANYQGRASDAKMRAFRNKAPASLIKSMSTWLDKAIARDEFKDWENPPTSMNSKDCG